MTRFRTRQGSFKFVVRVKNVVLCSQSTIKPISNLEFASTAANLQLSGTSLLVVKAEHTEKLAVVVFITIFRRRKINCQGEIKASHHSM